MLQTAMRVRETVDVQQNEPRLRGDCTLRVEGLAAHQNQPPRSNLACELPIVRGAKFFEHYDHGLFRVSAEIIY